MPCSYCTPFTIKPCEANGIKPDQVLKDEEEKEKPNYALTLKIFDSLLVDCPCSRCLVRPTCNSISNCDLFSPGSDFFKRLT